jgi:hypothetical protein
MHVPPPHRPHSTFISAGERVSEKPQQPRNKKALHVDIPLISSRSAVDSHKFKTLSLALLWCIKLLTLVSYFFAIAPLLIKKRSQVRE